MRKERIYGICQPDYLKQSGPEYTARLPVKEYLLLGVNISPDSFLQ